MMSRPPQVKVKLKKLTMVIAGDDSAKTTIMPANHTFLLDKAYARSAEKAGIKLNQVNRCFEREELGRTAECNRAQYGCNY